MSFHSVRPQLAFKLNVRLGGVSCLARATYGDLGELEAPMSVSEFFDRFADLFKNLNIRPQLPILRWLPKYVTLGIRDAMPVWPATCSRQDWIETVGPTFTNGEYI